MVRLNRSVSAAVLLAFAAPLAIVVTPVLAQTATASGEVRRVDAAKGKITIKHGQIGELGLPAMTLVYAIDPALLAGIGPGDKVTFTASRQNGQYVISKISK
ncbi:MAG: copper-binding protein [Pusillimonas sp.]